LKVSFLYCCYSSWLFRHYLYLFLWSKLLAASHAACLLLSPVWQYQSKTGD
jgi:hypothetical protein